VYVYNTNGVCDMYGWIIDDIKALKTVNNETVKAVVDEHIQKSNILIILDDFKYLLKGGRVNRIKLLIAKHLRFTLLLDLDKEKGVNMAGKIIKLDKLSKIINEHYKQAIRYNGNNIDKLVIFTSGVETKKKNVDSIVNILKTTFKDINIKYSELPSVFAAHLGTNYVAIAIKTK
jgi:fatty acid-binding protein DegV